MIAAWLDQEAAFRWLRAFPGHRLEAHLAEPTENGAHLLLNQPDRMRLICEPLPGIA